MVHCVYLGVTGYVFQQNIVSLSLKMDLVLANSADPDEMQHDAAFYLSLHCLSKYPCRGFWSTKGLTPMLDTLGWRCKFWT